MEKIIKLSDVQGMMDLLSNHKDLCERLGGKPKGTKITITDHDSGKVLGVYENKVVITGSMFAAMNIFGIGSSLVLPSYNSEMNFDYDDNTKEHDSGNLVQLFCIGDDGCGATQKDVYEVNYTDRIAPLTDIDNVQLGCIYPFRYETTAGDLRPELRAYYFGRKTYQSKDRIGYYFKNFDTEPQLYVMYTDGTQVDDNMYSTDTTQTAECYVETRLRVTRDDFRDFFENVIGWDNARISSLSLCYAWEYIGEDGYKYYQDIYPYTKLNFGVEFLVDLTKAIDFNYCIYY